MGGFLLISGIFTLVLAFILLVSSNGMIGVVLLVIGSSILALSQVLINAQTNINLLFANGDIKGKDLKYIESIMGPHTKVDIASNGERVYSWSDGNDLVVLEVLCNKKNVCKEVLKRI